MRLDFGFKAVHVDSAVASSTISIMVRVLLLDMVCGLLVLPLWPDTFFQLYEASHICGKPFRLPRACRVRLEAAVALVGCQLLYAYHGLGFTYQRNLQYVHKIMSVLSIQLNSHSKLYKTFCEKVGNLVKLPKWSRHIVATFCYKTELKLSPEF